LQLKQLGDSLNIAVFGNPQMKDPVKIYNSFQKELADYDVIIVDTAGRDALNDELIEELNSIRTGIHADETLLVMSADVGQAAESQAKVFHETCNVTGVIITKMDGTAKGGGALTACAVTQAPVKFLGVGEKVDALEEFKPERFVGRLLGMGDLESLLEKAREAITEEEAEDLGRRFLKGEFNLIDLYEQMQAMKKMGPLNKIVEMIPGFSQLKLPKEALESQQGKLEKWRIAMDSMTKAELEDPEIMDPNRIRRICQGSGVTEQDIRDLIKQYRQAKKLVKMMKGSDKNMQKMMKQMQSGGMGMKH
jgi:signal recognition particle subunit SRP54